MTDWQNTQGTNERFYSFLGIAAKAGAVVCGADAVDKAVKRKHVRLVTVDGGASESTKKAFRDACGYYHTDILILDEAGMLGESLGKPGIKIAGIKDAGFAKHAKIKYGVGSGGERI